MAFSRKVECEYSINMAINSKKVSDFVRNEMIFSVLAMPGMDYHSYQILKMNDIHTPWNLYNLYTRFLKFRMLQRIDKFSRYLVKLGIKENKVTMISIVMEAKSEYIRIKKLKQKQAWILPHRVLVDYF